MMRSRLLGWARLLLGGALLFEAAEAGCLSGALRDLSDDLDGWADDVDGEDETIGEVIDDWLD